MKDAIASFWLVACIVSGIVLADQISIELDEYRAEGRCIASFIAMGVERRDIKAKDGVCYVAK